MNAKKTLEYLMRKIDIMDEDLSQVHDEFECGELSLHEAMKIVERVENERVRVYEEIRFLKEAYNV